jgi:hypothetical protein
MEMLLRDLLTSLLLWLLYRSRRERWSAAPDRRGPGSVIRPAAGLSGLGWAWLVWVPCASWLIVNAVPALRNDPAARWIPTTVTCFALPFGALLILRARRSLVFFNHRGVIFKPTFARFQHVSWNKVQQIEYWPIRGRLAFRTKGHVLAIWLGFAGLSALLDQARRSVPKVLWRAALDRVEKDYLQNES